MNGLSLSHLVCGSAAPKHSSAHIMKLMQASSTFWLIEYAVPHFMQAPAKVLSLSEAFRRHVLAFHLITSLPRPIGLSQRS